MSKEQVYIVLSHINRLKKGSRTEWEVSETVEFVNQLRKKHYTGSSAIGDYLNEIMISGSFYGFDSYSKFDEYIRKKYSKQLKELDSYYKEKKSVNESDNTEIIVDSFGNVRTKTIFDV